MFNHQRRHVFSTSIGPRQRDIHALHGLCAIHAGWVRIWVLTRLVHPRCGALGFRTSIEVSWNILKQPISATQDRQASWKNIFVPFKSRRVTYEGHEQYQVQVLAPGNWHLTCTWKIHQNPSCHVWVILLSWETIHSSQYMNVRFSVSAREGQPTLISLRPVIGGINKIKNMWFIFLVFAILIKQWDCKCCHFSFVQRVQALSCMFWCLCVEQLGCSLKSSASGNNMERYGTIWNNDQRHAGGGYDH